MKIIDQVVIVGIFILFLISLLFILINIQRNRINNRRRITPEISETITRLIYARNVERIRQNYEKKKKEIEMIKMEKSIVIVNPNEDIVLGV
tara:strand:+ start:641 stop:916 length:276 start_codon:yes stop_codon:yes gene_type:complete